jgi:hypothetical protein
MGMIRRASESGRKPESGYKRGRGCGRSMIVCLNLLILGFGIAGCQTAGEPAETLAATAAVVPARIVTSEAAAPTIGPIFLTSPVTATAIPFNLPTAELTLVDIPVMAATAAILPTQTDLPTLTATVLLTAERQQPIADVTATPSMTELPTSTPTEIMPVFTLTVNETLSSTPVVMATETPTSITPTLLSQTGVTVSAVQDTTCRRYPMRNSNPLGNLAVNTAAAVEGKDSSGEWFFIFNPTNPVERMCWVWSGTLTVNGDVTGLGIIPDSIND